MATSRREHLKKLDVRLTQEERDALEKAATLELRSMSSMARSILVGWLKETGYLPDGLNDP